MYISHLAENTQRQKLLDLDALYNQTDKNFGFGTLDKALRDVDVDTLTSILDSFFNHLNNKSRKSVTAEIRFKTAVQFVKDISNRISRSLDSETYKKIERQLNKTFSEYRRLHLHKSKQSEVIRALPESVLSALLSVVEPNSALNPFKREKTQWTVFALVGFLDELEHWQQKHQPAKPKKESFLRRHYWLWLRYWA